MLKGIKSKKLSSIIRNEYLKSIIYPLLIIELTLLVAYFWSNHFVTAATQNALLEENKVNIAGIAERSAKSIDLEFRSVGDITKLLQSRHQQFFSEKESNSMNADDKSYLHTSDGVLYNLKKKEDSCTLFYSSVSKNEPARIQKAVATEKLDPFYNATLSTNDNIVQVYFNSYDSMNRLCPFMDDALGQYPHDINIPTYNFYYLADQKHNPKRSVVWTDAYLDPAGLGWMISAIAPVYRNDFLEGVVGIDITLEKILTNILSIKLPYTSYAMLVDQHGNIIAMNKGLEPIIGIKEVSGTYDKPVEKTISKPKDFNLLKEQKYPITQLLGDMFKNHRAVDEFNGDSESFLVTQNTIDQTGWRLIILVDKNSLLAKTTALKHRTDNIGYAILGLMALFYIVFFMLIMRRSKNFSKIILDPIENLVKATDELKNNLKIAKFHSSNIHEIDILIDNFTRMGDELKSLYVSMNTRIEEGIASNLETQKMMIHQSRLAAMGEMISMIAHQWRQPVNAIAVMANNLYMDVEFNTLNEERLRDALLNTIDLTQELSKTIDDFRNFFKPDNALTEANLSTIVNDAVLVIGKSIDYANITIEKPDVSDIVVTTHARELVQVIVNIMKNAKDAFEIHPHHNQKITIRFRQESENIFLSICDNAGGISDDVIDKIFDPYFSTKQDVNGTGLGLYVSKIIVEKHLKGNLRAYNHEEGVCFEIALPLSI